MTGLRLGIVGLGTISRFYLAAVEHVPGLQLTAVCDLRPDAMSRVGPSVARYTNHRDLLNHVDAVVVTVPNDRHAEVCRDALVRGIAVCVEKPLAHRLTDGVELARLARQAGTPLFTAFHRRYNANVRDLHGQVDGAAVESVRVRYLERIEDHIGGDRWYLDPRRCGGGCVADNGPNAFDLVRFFLGDVRVTAAEVSADRDRVDRQAAIVLQCASGATGHIELDWSYPSGELKDVMVRLTNGTELRADMLAGYPGFKGSLWHEYVEILRHFEQAVRAGGADRADDGLPALRLVHETYEVATSS